ncbi:murein biosynthesis integral membrane protein MurJ [Simiduia sp. 21SJ11W-1]|uniref:murein biosynthesis integral membrane protein MurJ n=1 Tax=Simiduia sp. 21SJ11W-1 TaxID=2909669 RepID=UPI00209E9C65|nr:murein biosynthesis integral membrane protein MurJ [Simiduia sp. 21SJ11W-1]UTA49679.1 murein biosynthesis integral membrane protein MurJ [Simiduia sp. 21SJ11W-1]
MTFLSRILGLVRDMVFARFIGAEAGADAFFVAFKIPNFLRRLFAEGAFAQAFVPVLSEYRSQGSHAAVQALVNAVAGCLGSALVVITLLACLGAPWVAWLFAPGFSADPAKFALVSEMIRITFPYLLLISLTGLAGAILNSYDRFAVPAVTPVLLNISLIFAAVVASGWFEVPVLALAWGVFAAGCIQLLFQLPFLARIHLLPVPSADFAHPGVKRVMVLMVPALFGVSVSQINLLLDTVLASFLPTGSVSWLYYSDRLAELPLGVFGVAIATVILPSLSRQHASADAETFNKTLNWSLRMVLLVALPSTLALLLLAVPILSTLFLYGKTSVGDIAMSGLSLQAYALGLTAFMLIKVLAPGFYARQDMKTPVRIGVVAMVANMVLNLAFVLPLHSYFQLGHVGLALATAVSSLLNAGLLYWGLASRKVIWPDGGWRSFAVQALVANAALLAWLLVILQWAPQWALVSWWQRAGWLALICGVGFGVYALGLVLAGMRMRHLKTR